MIKINVENIRKVIAHIADEQNHFDMMDWYEDIENPTCSANVCGTPSCIGGWAEAIMLRESGAPRDTELGETPTEDVGQWLGLSLSQAFMLFYPNGIQRAYFASRQQAIDHLNYIIETGRVDWAKFV